MLNYSPEFDKIVPALAQAREGFGPLFKNGKNPHLNSKYVLLDDILAMLENDLESKGFLIQSGPKTEIVYHTNGAYPLLTVTIRVWHLESLQWVEISGQAPFEGIAGGTKTIQGYGSTITYLRRYLLTLLFNLSTETDTDGHTGTQGPSTRSNGQAQKITVDEFLKEWQESFDDVDEARVELEKEGEWKLLKKNPVKLAEILARRKAKA